MTSARALLAMRKQGSHLSNTAASLQLNLARADGVSGQVDS